MKIFNGLIVPVVCVGIMIGGWIWLFVADSGPGSYAVPLIPPLIILNIALFIVAIVFIVKFFNALNWEDHLKAANPPNMPNIPEALHAKKNYKALVGAVVQIAIIIAAAIWVSCSTFGIIFSLPAIAVIIALALGAELCLKKFRRPLK